ncbi:MAG TPA: PAS domain-containing sensor histidine kinase [Anaerolinea thermolimosa]|uniref:histidine kinase n=1 Tax=Anaerolinea thermolimosa TaxID=229919 RepID=A0A3D1JI85_9CHLR|nr:PAS domain S-box protein [Anaerolinea thermolimosa]GAP08295.1 protein containing PAS domain S-box [Anaerolinea thermolimosa]HCE17326.1 PAS domain-containing sensor histidine kinase [Anaerolinea thermolimosa]
MDDQSTLREGSLAEENGTSVWATLAGARGVLLAVLDESNCIRRANQGLLSLLNIEWETLQGTILERWLSEGDGVHFQKRLDEVRQTNRPGAFWVSWRSSAGHPISTRLTVEPLSGQPGWLLIAGQTFPQADPVDPLNILAKLPFPVVIRTLHTGQLHPLTWPPGVHSRFPLPLSDDLEKSSLYTLCHPEDRERLQAHDRTMAGAADGEVHTLECRLPHTGGEWRWFLIHETAFSRAPGGEATQVLSALQSIHEQHREEEEQLRLIEIIESTPDVIGTLATSGEVVYLNWAAREFFGVGMGSLNHLSLENLAPRREVERIQQEGIPAALREGFWSSQAALLSAGGEEMPVSLVLLAHSSDSGTINHFSFHARDTREAHRLAEELRRARDELEKRVAERTAELRRSETLYRTLAEAAPDIVMVISTEGKIEYANQRAAFFFGKSVEELNGQSVIHLFPEDAGQRLWKRIRQVVRSGQALAFESKNIFHGVPFWLDTILVPVHDEENHLTHVLGVSRDVSRRKQIEEDLYRSRHMLQLILDHIPQRVFWKDTQLRFLGANRAFLEDAGLNSVEELIGKLDTDLPWKANAAQYQADDRAVMESGEEKLGYEEPQTRPDGHTLWLQTSKIPLRERDGHVFGVLGTYEDITEIKRTAQSLAALNTELARSNAELEQFASVVSHDLQEPLRMIASFTQLLERRYGGQMDERGRKYMGYIVQGTQRMQQMIHDLLAYSRVSTHARPLVAVDCNRLVEQVIFNLQATLQESGGRVEVSPLPVIKADEPQLFQVFQNLIGNALKFRREGVSPLVQVSASREAQAWRFAIADNGIGIDPQFKERIFNLFQRLHTPDEYPGTGIGLALCRKIIRKHGGEIWFDSTPGKGSTFFFTIPDQPEEDSS